MNTYRRGEWLDETDDDADAFDAFDAYHAAHDDADTGMAAVVVVGCAVITACLALAWLLTQLPGGIW